MQILGLGQELLLWFGFSRPQDQHWEMEGSISSSLFSFANWIPPMLVPRAVMYDLASWDVSMTILNDFLEFIIMISRGFHPWVSRIPLISSGLGYDVSKVGSNP